MKDPRGFFTNKVTPDIDGFTDEPVVQCNFRVVKDSFVDDSIQIIQTMNRYK